jgi:hypothetical protein
MRSHKIIRFITSKEAFGGECAKQKARDWLASRLGGAMYPDD